MIKSSEKRILALLRQRAPLLYENLKTPGVSTEELLFRFQLDDPEYYYELLEEVTGGEEARYRRELV